MRAEPVGQATAEVAYVPIGSLCLLASLPLTLCGWLDALLSDLGLTRLRAASVAFILFLLRLALPAASARPLSTALLILVILLVAFRSAARAHGLAIVLGAASLLLLPLPLALSGTDPQILPPLFCGLLCGLLADAAGSALLSVLAATLAATVFGRTPNPEIGVGLFASLDLYQTLLAAAVTALGAWRLRRTAQALFLRTQSSP